MEVPGGANNKFFVSLYEFIGTALLIVTVNISNDTAVAVGIVLFTICIFIGPISGGHVNPAVSVGVYIKEGKYSENACFLLTIISS